MSSGTVSSDCAAIVEEVSACTARILSSLERESGCTVLSFHHSLSGFFVSGCEHTIPALSTPSLEARVSLSSVLLRTADDVEWSRPRLSTLSDTGTLQADIASVDADSTCTAALTLIGSSGDVPESVQCIPSLRTYVSFTITLTDSFTRRAPLEEHSINLAFDALLHAASYCPTLSASLGPSVLSVSRTLHGEPYASGSPLRPLRTSSVSLEDSAMRILYSASAIMDSHTAGPHTLRSPLSITSFTAVHAPLAFIRDSVGLYGCGAEHTRDAYICEVVHFGDAYLCAPLRRTMSRAYTYMTVALSRTVHAMTHGGRRDEERAFLYTFSLADSSAATRNNTQHESWREVWEVDEDTGRASRVRRTGRNNTGRSNDAALALDSRLKYCACTMQRAVYALEGRDISAPH